MLAFVFVVNAIFAAQQHYYVQTSNSSHSFLV